MLDGCLEVIVACISCLLVGCFLVNEGARESSSGQAITLARYDEETLVLQIITPQQGIGVTTTVARVASHADFY